MKAIQYPRTLGVALIGAALTCAATVALADIKNYEFRLVEPTVKAGPDKTIAVKLVDKMTGKPVPDAVIFATRLDMAPDGMPEMATRVDMAGRWQLSLGAKVQGEIGTVENMLVIQADQ